VALAGLTIAPAGASGSPSGDEYYTPPTPYHNVGNFDPGCRGADVKLHYDYEGVYSDKNVPGTHSQAFFHKDEFDFTETWTLKGSDEVLFTQSGHLVYEEVSATRAPKSEVPKRLVPKKGLVGPIYRFTATEIGSQQVRDVSNDVLVASYGKVVYKQLFDTKGDSKPGGRTLSFRTAKVIGPHPDVNLCKLAEQVAAQ
jgi:hypothetical protein